MIRSANDVLKIEEKLKRIEQKNGYAHKIEIFPLIETISGLKEIRKIASISKRINSILLGMQDLFSEMNINGHEVQANYIRNLISIEAKIAGLFYLESPYLDHTNYSGLFREYERAIQAGADGFLMIHPDHISIANNLFKISEKDKIQFENFIKDYKGGCEIHSSGEFLGPPKIKRYNKLLSREVLNRSKVENGLTARTVKYGLDLDTVYSGQVITCPYEITIDASWITQWSSLVSMGNYIETSKIFAQETGLKERILPFSAMLNLTLCMAVEPFSETCLLHLGLEDVTYERPAYPGDTFQCFIHVESLRNTSDHKRSVVRSQHVLMNQHGDRVISFKRNTLFPYINNVEQRTGSAQNIEVSFLEKLKSDKSQQLINFIKKKPSLKNRLPNKIYKPNELIIHDAMRHIGESENLLFTTLFRNTHPIHFNYSRYPKEKIVVCGGFVLAVVLGNAMKDFKQVLDQQIVHCSHINKIAPGDTMSSVSHIVQRETVNDYELLTIKTIGLRNVDPNTELIKYQWPPGLFNTEIPKPSQLEMDLKTQMPELFHKVCIQVLWKIWRQTNTK
jgi:acyl dehydratase